MLEMLEEIYLIISGITDSIYYARYRLMVKMGLRPTNEELNRITREGIPGMRGYWEIIDDLHNTPDWNYKKLRKIHKELKAYGSGVSFVYRHPMLPSYLALAAAGVAIVIWGLKVFAS